MTDCIKCPKCKKRWADPGQLCDACAFVPKVGKLVSGRTSPRPGDMPISSHDMIEDDYGEESDADSGSTKTSEELHLRRTP